MKIEKLSLSALKNVLSRAELRKIMAGSTNRCDYCGTGGYVCCTCYWVDGSPAVVGPFCANSCVGYCASYGLGSPFYDSGNQGCSCA